MQISLQEYFFLVWSNYFFLSEVLGVILPPLGCFFHGKSNLTREKRLLLKKVWNGYGCNSPKKNFRLIQHIYMYVVGPFQTSLHVFLDWVRGIHLGHKAKIKHSAHLWLIILEGLVLSPLTGHPHFMGELCTFPFHILLCTYIC